MKRHLPSSKAVSGFTLVEMLVSMTVLVVIVVLVAQLTNSATLTVTGSTRRMDADTQARMTLGRMAREFDAMVRRPDIDYSTFKQPGNVQTGNDRFAFYAETIGYFTAAVPSSTERGPVALVGYQLTTDPHRNQLALRRLGRGLGWDPNGSDWSSVAYLPVTLEMKWPDLFTNSNTADYTTVGDQVFRMEYTYLLKGDPTDPNKPARLSVTPWDTTTTPPHTSADGFKDVAAVVVALAVLDSTSRVIVSDYAQLSSATLFPDATDNVDIASTWNAAVNSPNFAASANIPVAAAAAVRIYQQYFTFAQK